MAEPNKEAKLVRLEKSKQPMATLLVDSRRWTNECEEVFNEFRIAIVHLRKDGEVLDKVEDKEVVWRFICKLSKDRRPFWNRCEEVIGILMQSDEWMKAFVQDPETSADDLPTNVIKDVTARCEEVGGQVSDHVRLAIVGCGAAAARHCAHMSRYNSRARSYFFRVAVLGDPDARQAAALQAAPEAHEMKLGPCAVVTQAVELIEKLDSVHGVVLCTHLWREELTQVALQRGKFIFAEPPLAVRLRDAEEIADLAATSGDRPRLLLAEPGGHWAEAAAAASSLRCGPARPFAAEAHAVLPASAEAARLLEVSGGDAKANLAILAPALRPLRVLQQALGKVEEALAAAWQADDHHGPLGAQCLLRHEGGAISSLRVQVGGPSGPASAGPLSRLVLRTEHGDVAVEDAAAAHAHTEILPAESSSPSPSPKQQRSGGLASGDRSPQERTPASAARVDRTGSGHNLSLSGSHSSSSTQAAQAHSSEDILWELFAKQVSLSAPSQSEAEPAGEAHGKEVNARLEVEAEAAREVCVKEVAARLQEHLADLRVLEALRQSLVSRCFEPVAAAAGAGARGGAGGGGFATPAADLAEAAAAAAAEEPAAAAADWRAAA